MVASFLDYMGWVSLSFNLRESFKKAEQTAIELGYQQLDISHLLFALIDNPEAAIALSGHNIDRQQLRHQLTHHALAFTNKGYLPSKDTDARTVSPEPAKRIQHLMALASQKADISGKTEIDGEDVIKALIELEQQGGMQYSKKNVTKHNDSPSMHYSYQKDLFAYDQNNKLLNWGIPKHPAGQPELYLSPHRDLKPEIQPLQTPDPRVLELPENRHTGPDKIMKYSYPDHDTVEYKQIRSSLNSLMQRRSDAEKVLKDCEWYQLLKNLEQVSDDLDDTAERHQKKLAKKARQEIGKVDRWRKAYRYIKHIDDEMAKFRKLEKESLRDAKESGRARDVVFVEMEDRQLSRAIEERMQMLEKHVGQLEKKLKHGKKSKKNYSISAIDEATYTRPTLAASPDYYLESLKDKISSLEEQIDKKDYHIVSLQEKASQSSPASDREKVTLKHEIDFLQKENSSLNHQMTELQSHLGKQDTRIISLREKASRRKQRLASLSSQHGSLVPELQGERATLKHEVSMLQDENDRLVHKIAELETRHNTLAQEYSGSSTEVSTLRDAHDRIVEKNDKRKRYILSLEEQIKGLESNNQRQDKVIIELHSEIEGLRQGFDSQLTGLQSNNERQDKLIIELHSEIENYKTTEERNKQVIERLVAEIGAHKDSTHLLAQEKLTLDERLKLAANESDGQGQTVQVQQQKIKALEDQVKAHEEFSQTREQRVKTLQTEVQSSQEVMQSINEKLGLQKDKAASRERHVRTLEQHVKAQENEISILKKQMASRTTQAVAPQYAAPGRRSTVMWRDTDSLVEIVRAGH